jgi:hypothetical protein
MRIREITAGFKDKGFPITYADIYTSDDDIRHANKAKHDIKSTQQFFGQLRRQQLLRALVAKGLVKPNCKLTQQQKQRCTNQQR